MVRRVTIPAVLLLATAAVTPGRAAQYSIAGGAYERAPEFAVSYAGHGQWHTTYHSEPPNPGGMHDTNDARDSSTQRWHLTFSHRASLRTGTLTSATGTEHTTGAIDHTHVDGLFRADDASERCTVAYAPRQGTSAAATVTLTVRRGSRFLCACPCEPPTVLARSRSASTTPAPGRRRRRARCPIRRSSGAPPAAGGGGC